MQMISRIRVWCDSINFFNGKICMCLNAEIEHAIIKNFLGGRLSMFFCTVHHSSIAKIFGNILQPRRIQLLLLVMKFLLIFHDLQNQWNSYYLRNTFSVHLKLKNFYTCCYFSLIEFNRNSIEFLSIMKRV